MSRSLIFLSILGVSGFPCLAQGFDLGLSYAQAPTSTQNRDYRGPGAQLAVDLGDPDRLRIQLCGGFQHFTIGESEADLASVGVQGAVWSQDQNGHLLLALEARGERISGPDRSTTYGRLWLRCGAGFRGIIVPLYPWKAAFLARGSDRVVPFTRVEISVPLWKTEPMALEAPRWEARIQLGLRFNLD
jgi:hypothetical protein